MRLLALLALVCAASATSAAAGSPDVAGTAYHADVPFPQFIQLWSEGWALKDQNGQPLGYASKNMPLGAYVQMYIHNGSSNPVSVTDVKLQGVSLTEAIAFGDQRPGDLTPASIHFSKLPQGELDRLVAAGEPVWWKVAPPSVPAGGYAEVTVRLRREPGKAVALPDKPPAPSISPSAGARAAEGQARGSGGGARKRAAGRMLTLEAVAAGRTWTAQVRPVNTPRFAGISFSPGLETVYAYAEHPAKKHPAPVRILLDGEDVTARAVIAADRLVKVAPVVITLPRPLARGSFHCFEAVYADGSSALAGVRAWGDELVYGMWGYSKKGATPEEQVSYYLNDLHRHNINAVMESYGKEVADYLSGESGVQHSRELDIRAMRNRPGDFPNPVYYFLTDEPDAHDYSVSQLAPNQRLGVLGQDVVRRSDEFRRQDPLPPHLLNLDNTYKPENWYMYAQLPDVCCADPYYQEQQRIVWNERPAWVPHFIKPLYVLGAATICQSACAPKPLHIILNSVRHDIKGGPFRFATPPEKTVELFYALGAGAKSFSYWWYTPYGEFYGCGADDAKAVALWRQIGLLGAQVRTAGPVITRSCPAVVPTKASPKLWTRTLLAGADTLMLLAVNEEIANGRQGTIVVPLASTPVTLSAPAWLKVKDGFEVTPQGLRDVEWKSRGGEVVLALGRTDVAHLIVLTGDKALRGQLDQVYRTRFAANVAALDAVGAE